MDGSQAEKIRQFRLDDESEEKKPNRFGFGMFSKKKKKSTAAARRRSSAGRKVIATKRRKSGVPPNLIKGRKGWS